jgi:hypothetical protein
MISFTFKDYESVTPLALVTLLCDPAAITDIYYIYIPQPCESCGTIDRFLLYISPEDVCPSFETLDQAQSMIDFLTGRAIKDRNDKDVYLTTGMIAVALPTFLRKVDCLAVNHSCKSQD